MQARRALLHCQESEHTCLLAHPTPTPGRTTSMKATGTARKPRRSRQTIGPWAGAWSFNR